VDFNKTQQRKDTLSGQWTPEEEERPTGQEQWYGTTPFFFLNSCNGCSVLKLGLVYLLHLLADILTIK